jgi:hypothetical protein
METSNAQMSQMSQCASITQLVEHVIAETAKLFLVPNLRRVGHLVMIHCP